MLYRRKYLTLSIIGLAVMALGQFMARPQFYGTGFGRAWGHIFWLGFLMLATTLLTWFTRYIANHKNPVVVNAGKNELKIIAFITGLTGFLAITLGIYEQLVPSYAATHVTISGSDGDGRRGAFVWWLLLIVFFTLINLVLAIRKRGHFKRSR